MRFLSSILALGLALTVLAPFAPTQVQKGGRNLPWVKYTDQIHGFSFSYPESLKIEPRRVDDFGIVGLVACLDLLERSEPHRDGLRIMATDTTLFIGMGRPMTLAGLRQTCENYKEFRIGGRLAVNCVTCGRANCQWAVDIPGRIEFRIFSILTGVPNRREPMDWVYPEVSIIRSFQFFQPDQPNTAKKH
jgi:hypothetical protein